MCLRKHNENFSYLYLLHQLNTLFLLRQQCHKKYDFYHRDSRNIRKIVKLSLRFCVIMRFRSRRIRSMRIGSRRLWFILDMFLISGSSAETKSDITRFSSLRNIRENFFSRSQRSTRTIRRSILFAQVLNDICEWLTWMWIKNFSSLENKVALNCFRPELIGITYLL